MRKMISFKFIVAYILFFVAGFAISFSLQFSKKTLNNYILAQSELYSPAAIRPEQIDYSFIPLGVSFKNINISLSNDLKSQLALSSAKNINININPFYLLIGKVKISHLKIAGIDVFYEHHETREKVKSKDPKQWIKSILELPIQKLSIKNSTVYLKSKNNSVALKRLNTTVSNSGKQLKADLKIDSISLLTDTFNLSDLELKTKFQLSPSKTTITQFSIKKIESFLEMNGSVDGDMNSFDYQQASLNFRSSFDFSDFNEVVPLVTPFKSADGELKSEVRLTKRKKQEFKYEGFINSNALSINQYHLGKIKAQLEGLGKTINFKNIDLAAPGANLNLAETKVNISGKMPLSTKINIKSFELQQYLKNLNIGGIPLHMKSTANLSCNGTLNTLRLDCSGQSFTDHLDVVFREPNTDSLFHSFDIKNTFKINLTKKGVSLDTQLNMQEAEAHITGFVDFKEGYDLKFDTHVKSLEQSFIDLAQLKMKGSLKGKGTFVGDTNRGRLNARALSKDFMLDDFFLGDSQYDLSYDQNILNLSQVKTQLRNSKFDSNISIDLNKNTINLATQSKKVQIQDIFYSISNHLKLPVKVSGYGNFKISLDGPIKLNMLNHQFDGSFYNLFAGEENFDTLELKTSSQNGNLISKILTFKKANSVITGNIDLKRTGVLNASFKGTPIELQSLDILNNRNYKIDGLMTPLVIVSNYINDPEYNVNLNFKKLYYDNQFYDSSFINFKYSNQSTSGESQFFGLNKLAWDVPFTEKKEAFLSANLDNFNFSHLLKIVLGATHLDEFDSNISAKINLKSKSDYLWNSNGQIALESFSFGNRDQKIKTSKPYLVPVYNGVISNQNIDLSNGSNTLKFKINKLSKNNINTQSESSIDLSLLQILFPFVENLKGNLISFFNINGDYKKPRVKGNSTLKNGYFSFEDLQHSVSNLDAEVKVKDDKFYITSLKSNFAGGNIIGSGHLKLDLPLIPIAINLKGQGLTLELPEGMRTNGKGKLSITGNQSPYLFSGNYEVNGGSYVYNFDTIEETQEVILANKYLPQFVKKKKKASMLLDFDIKTIKPVKTNIIVNGSQTSISMDGQLKVHGELEKLKATGLLTSNNTGELIFRDNNFNILSANIIYKDQDITDPELNIKTQTLVNPKIQDDEDISQSYNISMDILGNAQNPTLSFSSQPILSEEDILSLLAVGVTSQSLDEDIDSGKQALKTSYEVGTDYIKSKLGITKALKKRTGLEVNVSSTIDIEDENAAATKFNIKKQFNDNLEVSASQTEGSSTANDMELRYKINKQISLSSQWQRLQEKNKTNNDDTIGVGIEYQIEFD